MTAAAIGWPGRGAWRTRREMPLPKLVFSVRANFFGGKQSVLFQIPKFMGVRMVVLVGEAQRSAKVVHCFSNSMVRMHQTVAGCSKEPGCCTRTKGRSLRRQH